MHQQIDRAPRLRTMGPVGRNAVLEYDSIIAVKVEQFKQIRRNSALAGERLSLAHAVEDETQRPVHHARLGPA